MDEEEREKRRGLEGEARGWGIERGGGGEGWGVGRVGEADGNGEGTGRDRRAG